MSVRGLPTGLHTCVCAWTKWLRWSMVRLDPPHLISIVSLAPVSPNTLHISISDPLLDSQGLTRSHKVPQGHTRSHKGQIRADPWIRCMDQMYHLAYHDRTIIAAASAAIAAVRSDLYHYYTITIPLPLPPPPVPPLPPFDQIFTIIFGSYVLIIGVLTCALVGGR